VTPRLAIAGLAAALAAAGPAAAADREAALAAAFKSWCLAGPPNFAALDARATGGKLMVESDQKSTTPATGAIETKVWEVADDPSGAFALTGGTVLNHGKRVTICGVAAPDAAGQAMLDLLSQAGQLGAPVGQRNSDDGTQRITQFKSPFAHTTILLADGTPQNADGVILNITQVREPGR
jgi:hypothetical protein